MALVGAWDVASLAQTKLAARLPGPAPRSDSPRTPAPDTVAQRPDVERARRRRWESQPGLGARAQCELFRVRPLEPLGDTGCKPSHHDAGPQILGQGG